MATGTLVFGFQTQIKNVLDPTANTDAATKEYVDSKTGSGATLGASGSDTDIQFNQSGNISANNNLTYDYANSILTVIGNLVSSNANLGNAVTANFYIGDGGLLSNIKSDGGFANTVAYSAQPNITSVGNLVNLQIGNSSTGTVIFDGTGDANLTGNLNANGNIIANNANFVTLLVGNTSSNVYIDNAGDINAAGNITVGTGTGGTITGANSIIANFFIGNGSNLSNISIGNLTGTTLPSTIIYSNLTTVGTLTSLVVTGNLSSGNANLGNLVTANYFTGNGSLLSHLTGSNIVGQVANANIAGQVYTNAQPNITSVGNLTSLTVAGNTSLGPIANVNITGGSSGQYLQTDGTGNLTWATVSTSTLKNGNSNISITDNGNISFSVDGTTDSVVFATDGSITLLNGNINGANVINATTVVLGDIVSGSDSVSISSTTETLIDQFPKSSFRTAKYIVSARNDDGYEAMEVLLIHDNMISFITTYGDISTGIVEDIITISSNIVSGNICLYAQGSNSNTYVKLISTYVTD
jgi:hypothetical protein